MNPSSKDCETILAYGQFLSLNRQNYELSEAWQKHAEKEYTAFILAVILFIALLVRRWKKSQMAQNDTKKSVATSVD